MRFTGTTRLPPRDWVEDLWDRHGMLENIREHSRVVCRVSLMIGDWLQDVGILLDRHALEVGALLHDIAKTPCLGTSRRHDLEGEKLLLALGYPELAYLVGVHVRLPDPHPVDESFVVYYADKRVKHDEVVDLAQRFSYIEERYGKGDGELIALIDKGRLRAMAAERQLFSLLEPHRTPQGIGT